MNTKQCHFCTNGVKYVDYKDVETLKRFVTQHSSILKTYKSGVCGTHQRKLAMAIKRARHLAILPFISR
ncbi:MAG: 30S ribosomal protein S18 [Candidatus Vogelbacteria bacterium]|nr:30S ribosomal protein S18 [Candidatus Vogelbacteria bacterium]